MENRYGYCSRQETSSIKIDDEFQEEDIWGVFEQRKDSDSWATMEPDFNTNRTPTAVLTRPKSSININPNSQKSTMITQQYSAPVNIPDWSKIYGTTSSKHSSQKAYSWDLQSDEEEDEEGINNVIPPHELIARNQISSFSVCEGVGRTLKGRDLSRVRNNVLTKTGFLEPQPHHN